ncbi:MAG: hypothetical protein P4L73_19195 [Caulobacteraceae bacterium]|nr:hypothetical protein [Caulobacteraceae bacterium]
MLEISVRSDIKRLSADLNKLAQQQIPYATALALTDVAGQVKTAEQALFRADLDQPTPFTVNGLGVKPGRKADPVATVFLKDIQAAYLAPYIDGGQQVLGSKQAILTPRDLTTNQYGNLPRGKLASLKGRPDLFVGMVKTRGGQEIGGVWQRVSVTRTGKTKRGKIANRGRAYSPTLGRLKLLIQFTRPATVTHHLPYYETAKRVIAAALPAAWSRALDKALATAR